MTIGESLNLKNIFSDIIDNTDTKDGKNRFFVYQKLRKAASSYSTEATKMALVQTKVNKNQIRSVLSSKGLTGETLKMTTAEIAAKTATNRMAASQATATGSTVGSTAAIKGLWIALQHFYEKLNLVPDLGTSHET